MNKELEIKFLKSQDIDDQKNVISLLENSFSNKLISENTRNAYFSGFCSNHTNSVLIKTDGKLVAIAITALRKIRFFDKTKFALSVGPVAVGKEFQGNGLGQILMKNVETLARDLGADLIYLVGIKGFYSKLGYKPFFNRSKITLDITEIPFQNNVRFTSYNETFYEKVKCCHNKLSSKFNFTSIREDSEWNWLLNFAKDSYYFYKPKVILDSQMNFVGYFTIDPQNENWLRESAYISSEKDILNFLSGIRKFGESIGVKYFEIMTPKESPIIEFCMKSLNFSFIEKSQVDGGQLVKYLTPDSYDTTNFSRMDSSNFIFQGDNL